LSRRQLFIFFFWVYSQAEFQDSLLSRASGIKKVARRETSGITAIRRSRIGDAPRSVSTRTFGAALN
jgi:hypothetical protein